MTSEPRHGRDPESDPNADADPAPNPQPPNSQPSNPQPSNPKWARFRARMAAIFADRRIYGRVRISTVVLIIAFLSFLWLYLDVRPAPSSPPSAPPPTSHTEAPADRQSYAPSAVPEQSSSPVESATPTGTPTGSETPGESTTPGEPTTPGQTPTPGAADRGSPTTTEGETAPAPTSASPPSE